MSQIIPLPAGATLIEATSFLGDTEIQNDTYVERMVMNVNGHCVNLLRYDHDNKHILTGIDGNTRTMHLNQVNEYIRRNT